MTSKHKRHLERMKNLEYAKIRKEKVRHYRHTDEYRKRCRNRRKFGKRSEYMKEYAKNSERKMSIKNWHLKNKERVRIYKTERAKKKRLDPRYLLRLRISCLLRTCLNKKNISKNRTASEKILGYSIEELKNHIEALFKPKMSWGNMGEWHIDHVVPNSWLPYSSINEGNFKIIWSLYNLQPLWKEENLKKWNKYVG